MADGEIKVRIDRAALELFADQGVDGTPMPAIALRAGVAVGSLYRHYSSKDDLAGRLYNENYARLAQRLDRAQRREAGTRAKLEAMIRLICRFFDDEWSLARFLLMEQHFRLKHFHEADNPADVVVGVLSRGCEAGEVACGDPLLGASCIMGAVIQAATFRAYGRMKGSMSEAAEDLVILCCRAVGAGEASR